MKAFEVFYQTPKKTKSMIVLVKAKALLEDALAKKDPEYAKFKDRSSIEMAKEKTLSTVMVTDLSVEELLTLMNKEMK